MNHEHSYRRLLAMFLFSFVFMYALMYAMVDRLANVFPNYNELYMAGLMAAPMLLIELLLMKAMYGNKRLNAAIAACSIALFAACWFGIREQAGIGDEQFLKSMIPHHAGAILMCSKADLRDPDIRALCAGIIAGQQKEIDAMKAKLEELRP